VRDAQRDHCLRSVASPAARDTKLRIEVARHAIGLHDDSVSERSSAKSFERHERERATEEMRRDPLSRATSDRVNKNVAISGRALYRPVDREV